MSKKNPKTAKMYARVHPWVKEGVNWLIRKVNSYKI